jgi:hypothetical protein
VIEPGKYRAKAVEWGIGEAQTGNYQIGVAFELLDEAPGTSITWYGSFTDAALEFTLKALRAMGWQGDDVYELDNGGGHLDEKEVQLVVDHEEYQGRVHAKVRWVNSLGGLAMQKRVSGDQLRGFAAGMKAKILGLEPGRRPAQAAPPSRPAAPAYRGPPEPPPHGDCDIPF